MASRCAAAQFRALSCPGRALTSGCRPPFSRHLATAAAAPGKHPSSPSPPPPPTLPNQPTASAASASASTSTSTSTTADPKIGQLVDTISGLTLLQAADLVTHLKTRLNIQEIALPAAAAPGAPSAGAGTPAQEAPAEEEKPKEKTIFNVMLESFEAGAKPKVIREVKALVPNLTLIDAKKFVESLPKVLKEGLSKEDADKLKATFEGAGAVVKLE